MTTNADEADIDTHTVWVTFFPNTRAQTWSGGEATLPQLAKRIAGTTGASKAKLPLLKLAKFGNKRSDKNCLRTDENVEGVTGIEVEHDAGDIPFEGAIEIVRKAKLRALAYTSPSWVAGVKEKWRILLPLAQEHAPASRAALVARVNGLFGGKLTDECFVLSQTFYFGHLHKRAHREEVIDGDFLDHRDDLKTGAVGKSTGTRKRSNVLAFSERDRTTPARSYDEIMELLEKSQTNNRDGSGNWHNAMLAATASMIGHGWSDDEIFDATEPYCERGWGDGDIAEMIEGGRKKWQVPDRDWLAKGGLGELIRQATEGTPDGGATPDTGGRPLIRYGALSEMADQAATALIAAKVPFYQRGNKLVRPVVQPVQSFGGKTTMVAQLVEIELPYLRDTLCRNSVWFKWNAKAKKWLPTHPHADAARVLLGKFGDWAFPTLAGIITTPTLRPNGTILKDAGYDPATQLLLIDPPPMPDIPEKPTKDDALAALKLLKELLAEFVFVDDNGVSLAVALSAQISAVCRGAYPLVPMHIGDAPAAGSGKSYLLNTVSWIATGQAMPTMGAGKDEAELGKRLDAAVIAGQQLVCIDNVVGEIGGETICRLTEQPRPQVRILGVSKLVTVDARSVTFYGNGNNVIVVGDLCRRVVTYRLDARTEHPELREFKNNPMEMILANRGDYIAACLTICRAYAAAGRPGRLPQLASYGEWSDTVRSALVWLGEADVVKSQAKVHTDDPEAGALLTVLNEWKGVVGAGEANARAVRDVIVLCDANSTNANGWKEYAHNGLRAAVLAVMPVLHNLKPDATALGYWLRSKKERRIGGLRFRNKPATGHSPAMWWVEAE